MASDKIGTIYIQPNGTVYQLNDYTPEFLVEHGAPPVGYSVMWNRTGERSGFTNASDLPEDAIKVWEPAEGKEVRR
jgi:hypothetical protein